MFADDFYDALLLVCDIDKFFYVGLRADLVGKLALAVYMKSSFDVRDFLVLVTKLR